MNLWILHTNTGKAHFVYVVRCIQVTEVTFIEQIRLLKLHIKWHKCTFTHKIHSLVHSKHFLNISSHYTCHALDWGMQSQESFTLLRSSILRPWEHFKAGERCSVFLELNQGGLPEDIGLKCKGNNTDTFHLKLVSSYLKLMIQF